MKPYYSELELDIFHGDNREVLPSLASESIDSIVTDPPYELGFMGKGWDRSGIAYDATVWRECLRVLKPGGHLLAFGGSRTYHRLVCAIEDAGFEIRDQIQWIYGSGFPKSLDVSKAIDAAAGIGLEDLPHRSAGQVTDRKDRSDGLNSPRAGAGRTNGSRNYHPTVKPIRLMRYLVRLITPPSGTVLDLFAGSGSTGKACALEGMKAILIEKEIEYCELAATTGRAQTKQSIQFN